MDFLLKISLMSILTCSLLPGQNSQATNDDNISSSSSPKSLIDIPNNNPDDIITCVRADRFNPDHLLICTVRLLYRYNIPSNSFQLIAGGYVGAYKEGSGSEAGLGVIVDVVQLNETALIVSDYRYACLRLIINTTTSTFAGNCSAGPGHADGTLLESQFYSPSGLLLVRDSIYVSDGSQIRQVNLATQTVSTLNFTSPSSIRYLTCGYPDCDLIYFTFNNGLATVTRFEPHAVTVLSGSESGGDETGSLNQTKFRFPSDLIFINRNQILIAEYLNDRIVQVNFTSSSSSNLYGIFQANTMICYKGTLYIGADKTLYSTSINDDSNGTECFGKVPDKLQYNHGDSTTIITSGSSHVGSPTIHYLQIGIMMGTILSYI